MITTPQDIENLQTELAEARATIRRFEEHVANQHRDKTSLEDVLKQKNAKVTALEAENVRLKMQRTDKENDALVDALRKEVGAKDKRIVELQRVIDKHVENEKIILGRAIAAEQRTNTFQQTLAHMQAARDASDAKLDAAEEARLESVRKMVDAVSAREGLDRKILGLLEVVSAVSKVVPLLPSGLLQSRDVRVMLALLKKLDVKPEAKQEQKPKPKTEAKGETKHEVKS